MDITALDRAIEAAGSQLALAKALGIKSPSISGWYDRGKVPVERVLAIETATGVSRHDLRPDVFGPSPANPTGEVADAA
ncbi:transcriptional regulator [Xanthomonas arboricola pv. juglandis]|uniref:transcriptional regulator n=1 Tax=Xanthomonas arboricola TaxID=56448 RepID=UPI00063EC0F5|nr:Cro/CI family transcriptional regulator [Xanthomonas arboricola]MDN0220788.1 Cro/CI family transcriptional regulator [Xanthomonas arboricola pv. juglandis]MDN0225059.1 Cro/CI family transcriptional regulator [Xanthomonas arboricola pv. juglandis]MDN0229273.1 Cro/CI family transcriptional regulator [Xanthomonas arboricola pv. juglandis]MDN0233697.1 Cro/CI family transcriptional regulator [Xanthomonas arboricola pv. juglandis]MDN0237957.1 Cro/CI family transcriptional regulator [Xanthomonas a